MVNSVSQTPQPPKNTVKTSIFYVNDVHSNLINLERLKSASDAFDSFEPSEKTDKLKLSAGDLALGVNKLNSEYALFSADAMNLSASAAGNHEFDLLKKDLVKVLENNKFKILALNLNIPETSEENKIIKKEIGQSYIEEKNGTKYGIIGIAPIDFAKHATHPQEYSDFEVLPLNDTLNLVQQEVDNLKKQGVNKIILLSHVGQDNDKEIAKKIEGIDVILGGHSHNLIKGVKEGENLFYSKKTGEPTIITQAGSDGKFFGVLNLEFDENGVIKNVQNNIQRTDEFERSPLMKFFSDKFFGKPQTIGKINSVQKEEHILTAENPSADFVADAMRNQLNTDIALINSANLRSRFYVGEITDRDLAAISPFQNKTVIMSLTEKELVDAIKIGLKSMNHPAEMPGILQVSGLRYKATKTGELKELLFIDKEGKETPIDINNPNTFKTYKAGIDDYLARGGNDYLKDIRNRVELTFDYDKDKVTADYIKTLNNPIDIKADGRITIID